MAALVQAASTGQDERPILLYQEGRAGHGVGKPVAKRADELADVLAFLAWQLGLRGAGGDGRAPSGWSSAARPSRGSASG